MEKIKTKKAAIAILARDCENTLKSNIKEINKLASYFNESEILVIENDSIDGTRSLLNKWETRSENVTILDENVKYESDEREGSGRNRIYRMAELRNMYIAYFKEKARKFDYLIVVDIDLAIISADKVRSAIIHAPDDWAGIFANGRFYGLLFNKVIWGKYYDNYAFVPFHSKYNELNYGEIRINNDLINASLKKLKYVPCISAFGGIGIYKFNYAVNSRYGTRKNKRSRYYQYISEHVPFNEQVSVYGSLYIASDMLVGYRQINILELLFKAKIKQSTMLKLYKNILKKRLPI